MQQLGSPKNDFIFINWEGSPSPSLAALEKTTTSTSNVTANLPQSVDVNQDQSLARDFNPVVRTNAINQKETASLPP